MAADKISRLRICGKLHMSLSLHKYLAFDPATHINFRPHPLTSRYLPFRRKNNETLIWAVARISPGLSCILSSLTQSFTHPSTPASRSRPPPAPAPPAITATCLAPVFTVRSERKTTLFRLERPRSVGMEVIRFHNMQGGLARITAA